MYNRSIGGWAKHWDFILIDTLCLQIAFHLAYYYRFGSFGIYGSRSAYRTSGFVLFLLSIVVAIVFNTMHNVLKRDLWEEIKNTLLQCGLVFATIVVLLFTSKDSDHVSRIVLYVTMGLYAIIAFTTRLIYKKILISHRRNAKKNKMLLVGDEAGIKKALAAFEANPEAGIDVRGLVLIGKQAKEINGIPVVAEEKTAGEYIRNAWIDEIYVACCDHSLLPNDLIAQCDEMALTVHQQMFTNENVKGIQWVQKIAKQPVLTTSIRIPKPRELMLKRAMDIVAGLLMSIAAAIVLIIVTPIIKIKSPGPVLLQQERIGRNGKKFKAYSIRTMYMDADRRMKQWRENNSDERLTPATDPRIIGNENGRTGIGYNLRQWGLDDLPKGFNVLLGSMSLVGTRAPSVSEWEKYENRHRARLSCKPGITGLWQASGRSKTMSFEEATKLDTEYIANWSIGLDLRILFRTVGAENRQTDA